MSTAYALNTTAPALPRTPESRHVGATLALSHYIEVIDYKKKGWIRAKDFYEGLFRTVSRLYVGRYPELVAVGLYFDVAVLPGSVEVHSGPLKLPMDP